MSFSISSRPRPPQSANPQGSKSQSLGAGKLWRDRLATVLMLAAMGAALWITRPARFMGAAKNAAHSNACLSNLNRISAAFAQYAQDYDGKFPRGIDPVDRAFPDTWRQDSGGIYYAAVRRAPLLHQLLRAYEPNTAVWHCPGDVGWNTSRVQTSLSSSLHDIRPSSWARFGTSYYYLTLHGLAGMTTADLRAPQHDILLFDGDFWHEPDDSGTLNALFSDGHAANLTQTEFNQALKEN